MMVRLGVAGPEVLRCTTAISLWPNEPWVSASARASTLLAWSEDHAEP